MERLKTITIIFLLAIGLLVPATPPFCFANRSSGVKPASVLLQEALYTEQIEGDLDAAIKLYEQVIRDSSAQRSHLAQAIYRQGMIYLKKQNEPQAKAAFEKLVAEFSDQTNIIEKVQPLLDDLSTPDLAALMPPETLIYLELGSPGRQIETILNMLKGTPFENPLAAIGANKPAQKTTGQKSPGDIMTALLNPSMMAEFKKIRGMAMGITEVRQNNPPMVVVLYPGRSDALRGIILAGLGVAGTAGEPIEGMQTITIGKTAGVAYDDRVIIIAQPMKQLTWCVKQYKGVTNEPTFASNSKSFAKVSKQARQENAMTIWANVDQVYSGILKMLPEDKMPKEIRAADAIADFENIDDLVYFLSIQESGIALEANVSFKDGHNCLAYSMIRTPNLSRDGFKAVPSETTALVSFALAEPESPGVTKAQKAVKNLTGLDIGREIFANIEQITLFAVPPGAGTDISGTPVRMLSSIGLALTSHNPQQTQQLIAQILGIANVVANTSANEQSGSTGGKYLLPLSGGQKVYCYTGQVGKTTVLAFSPEALENSLSAIKKRNSALTAGRLHEPLSQVAPDTSKLVLINIGGAIQVADAYINMTYDNPRNPVHKTLAQLAQACDKTYVQLRTGERVDNFNLHLSIDQLPSLDNIFPLIIQLSKIDVTAKAKATKPQPRNGITFGLKEDMKLNWKPGVNAKSHKFYFGTKADELSLLAEVSKPDEVNLPALKEDGQYYWRVDEVWLDGTVITGDVWSFSIGKLIGWWKLDGDATDSSGNDNHGTVNGDPNWIPGRIGSALEFDGLDDYVDLPDEMASFGGGFTVALWAYPTDVKTWARFVDFGNNVASDNIILGRQATSNDLFFEVYAGGSSGGKVTAPGAIELNKWQMLTGTVDEKGHAKLYKNGQLIQKGTTACPLNIARTRDYIGRSNWGWDEYFEGYIDEVRIYNYALSLGEIEALCRVTATKPWPVDEGLVSPTAKVQLSWTPGISAASHKVFFGTKPDELSLLAEGTTPTYAGFPPLDKNTTYYWRIDNVLADGALVQGDLWSFTTSGKLIGWWKFDESEGSSASDSSGNDHTGTLVGDPQWQPSGGKVGGALEFDGVDDYVNVGDSTDFDLPDQLTIAVWVKTNGTGNDEANPYIMTAKYGLKQKTSNVLEFYIFTDTWHVVWFNVDNSFNGDWHHLAGTYDGSELKLYIDGGVEGSTSHAGTMSTDTGDIDIGGNPEARNYYKGLIDDVRIYNYTLSEDELKTLYNEGKQK